MVKKIKQLLLVTLPIKRVWSFSSISQWIDNLAHITSYSLGSNYPKTVELTSPNLNAYNLSQGLYYKNKVECCACYASL